MGGVALFPPESAERFDAPSEPGPSGRPNFPSRAYCIPTTLLSFRLQGFLPPGDRTSLPKSRLPCRLTPLSGGGYGFEGLIPPRSSPETRLRVIPSVPSWPSPLWGSPFRRRGTGFPAPPLTCFLRLGLWIQEAVRAIRGPHVHLRVLPNDEPGFSSVAAKRQKNTGPFGVWNRSAFLSRFEGLESF